MSNRIGELFGKTGGVFLGSQFQRPVLGYLSTFSGRVMEFWSSPWILWGSDFRKLSWWPSRKPTPCSLYKSWQPHTIHIVKSMMASPQVTWYLCTDLHGFDLLMIYIHLLSFFLRKIARWQTLYHQLFHVSSVEATQSSPQYEHGIFIWTKHTHHNHLKSPRLVSSVLLFP